MFTIKSARLGLGNGLGTIALTEKQKFKLKKVKIINLFTKSKLALNFLTADSF